MSRPISMIPFPRHYHRRRKLVARAAIPGPVLLAAVYDTGMLRVELTFDRPLDIAGFDGAAVIVDDPVILETRLDGSGGAELIEPTIVQITLNPAGEPTGATTTLTATNGAGIVAADDQSEWAGATDLELPYP